MSNILYLIVGNCLITSLEMLSDRGLKFVVFLSTSLSSLPEVGLLRYE